MSYTAAQLGIKVTPKDAEWINGYNYDAASNTFGEKNQIWSKALGGAGSMVSEEVNRQSAEAQGKPVDEFMQFLNQPAQNSQPAVIQNNQATPVQNDTGKPAFGPTSSTAPVVPDINSLYTKSIPPEELAKLNKAVADAQAEIDAETANYNASKQRERNNPMYSASVLSGKLAAIDTAYNENQQTKYQKLQSAKEALTARQSDAEREVNISLKQYDLNRQDYQDKVTQANQFIASGALAGATAQDIAAIASATGMSYSMVKSLQDKQIKENTKPQLFNSQDDNGNLNIIAIDPYTGKELGRQVIQGVGKTGSGSVTDSKNITMDFQKTVASLKGKTVSGTYINVFPQLVAMYAPYMSLEEIYQKYANTEQGKKWGKPKESSAFINAVYQQARTGETPD